MQQFSQNSVTSYKLCVMLRFNNRLFRSPAGRRGLRLTEISLNTVFLLVFFLNLTSQAKAEVIINEVFPNPDPNAVYPAAIAEEIQNLTAAEDAIELTLINQNGPVSLNGWSLWDQESQPKILHSFEEEILEPNQYLVILCGNKLNNNGDAVILKNAAGAIEDQFSYDNSHKGLSFSRINNEGDFRLTYPTLEKSNSIFPVPTPSAAPISDSAVEITKTPTPAPSAAQTKSGAGPDSYQTSESAASNFNTDDLEKADNFSEKSAAASAAAHKRRQLSLLYKIKTSSQELQQLQSKPYKLSAKYPVITGSEEPQFYVEHKSPFAIIAVIISGACLLTSSLLIRAFV